MAKAGRLIVTVAAQAGGYTDKTGFCTVKMRLLVAILVKTVAEAGHVFGVIILARHGLLS